MGVGIFGPTRVMNNREKRERGRNEKCLLSSLFLLVCAPVPSVHFTVTTFCPFNEERSAFYDTVFRSGRF